METVTQTIPKPKTLLTEDWTVVVLGLLIIGVSISGLFIPAPAFGWKNGSEADNRRPLYAFLIAQTFNIAITLVIAYYLFG